jgi:hypothetical protein
MSHKDLKLDKINMIKLRKNGLPFMSVLQPNIDVTFILFLMSSSPKVVLRPVPNTLVSLGTSGVIRFYIPMVLLD